MRVATVRSKEILKLFRTALVLPPRDQARLQRRAHEILDHAVPEVALQLAEPDQVRTRLTVTPAA